MTQVVHDKADQLVKIRAVLFEGERVFAVYDGRGIGTGFIGLTDRRVIIQVNSVVGGKLAVKSLPYKRIQFVSFRSNKSMFGNAVASSTVAIQVGSRMHQVRFRGEEKARHVHDIILHYIVHS